MNEQAKHWSLYKTLARMSFPAVGKAVTKFALIQSQVDLARTACALERFRLAHGNYPERLAELVPTYLDKVPLDIVNGEPLHYRRTDNGKFVLYSIGLDGKDDGGDLKKDWAWPQLAEPR